MLSGLGFLVCLVLSAALTFYLVILGMTPAGLHLGLTKSLIYGTPGFFSLIIGWFAAIVLYIAGWQNSAPLRVRNTRFAWFALVALLILQLGILVDYGD
ncbi:MAG: hypothetical protein KME42_14630 [Tildeniella nuda ZEHNDER 1965/U140]|jgi:hypothetical protein|nr:hypothetical protein [Tildeniella nuda ZEHNDER 1965/U140]